jgi:hypothetical protein
MQTTYTTTLLCFTLIVLHLRPADASNLVRMSMTRSNVNHTHAVFEISVMFSVTELQSSRIDCQGCEVVQFARELVRVAQGGVIVVKELYTATARLVENYATAYVRTLSGSQRDTPNQRSSTEKKKNPLQCSRIGVPN